MTEITPTKDEYSSGYYDQKKIREIPKFKCPNCGRTIDARVSRCICGMEFK